MESENINIVDINTELVHDINEAFNLRDLEDGVVLNDEDPDFCTNAETFFKVINDRKKQIQKQQSVHSSENNSEQTAA